MSDILSTPSVRLTQAIWLVLAAVGTGVWAAGPASNWIALQTVCRPDSACLPFQLDASAAHTLSEHGVSLTAFALLTVVSLAAIWVVWYGLAALIIWRRPADRGALLAAFFLVVFPAWAVTAWIPASTSSKELSSIFVSALLLFGLLFPDGRFLPRWTRWVAGAIVVFLCVTIAVPAPPDPIPAVVFISLFLGVIGIAIHRYRSVLSWSQRQQSKWAVFGILAAIVGLISLWSVPAAPFPTGNGSLWLAISNVTGTALVVSTIPVSIGIAVLRNRLWDIDRVINRALVYLSLTGTLAVIYIGSVLGLEALLRLAAGGSSTLAIALSTLAVAALFGPLRRRIQIGIDRRFYRSKYDAERTLAAFGDRVRDEVDLTHLSQELTSVVGETLHPEHVSLWLRQG